VTFKNYLGVPPQGGLTTVAAVLGRDRSAISGGRKCNDDAEICHGNTILVGFRHERGDRLPAPDIADFELVHPPGLDLVGEEVCRYRNTRGAAGYRRNNRKKVWRREVKIAPDGWIAWGFNPSGSGVLDARAATTVSRSMTSRGSCSARLGVGTSPT
jgi:hypothetical protein